MKPTLPAEELERLFLLSADGALDALDDARLREALAASGQLAAQHARYLEALSALRSLSDVKAPPALATLITARARQKRRPSSPRQQLQAYMSYRWPAEIVVPLLLAVAVAAFVVLSAG